MPTLITPRMLFLHVPKTGGTWVQGALAAGGVPIKVLSGSSPRTVDAHLGLAETEDYQDRFTFAFVRHPLDWWRSCWGHRMRNGWTAGHQIDSRARSDDFACFIEQVVERLPGHLAERFSWFIGTPERPITFIGRYESLVEDLIRALRLAGESFDEAAIRSRHPENVNDYERFPALYRADLAAALAAAESALIRRFYAHDPIPQRLLRPAATRTPAYHKRLTPATTRRSTDPR